MPRKRRVSERRSLEKNTMREFNNLTVDMANIFIANAVKAIALEYQIDERDAKDLLVKCAVVLNDVS